MKGIFTKEKNLEIISGYAYHIKDSYFTFANDSNLMQNKERGSYRPTLYGSIVDAEVDTRKENEYIMSYYGILRCPWSGEVHA